MKHTLPKLAALLLPATLAASCALAPDSTHSALVCRVAPDGGPPSVADRGIGGTGAPLLRDQIADKGIGGTGIVGVVTGFASICLSGVEVALPEGTRITIDGIDAAASQLRAGQVAAITSTPSADGGLTAQSVAIHHEVSGPIEAIGDGEISVAGQRVVLTPGQRYIQPVAPGMGVAVSGVRRLDGAIVASRIDPADPDLVILHNMKPGVPLHSGQLQIPIASSQAGPFDVQGHMFNGRLVMDSVRPSPSLLDSGALFGATVTRVITESYVRRSGDRLELGSGVSVKVAPQLLTKEVDAHLAIVTLDRQPDGALVATDVDLRSGDPGEQKAMAAPVGRGPGSAAGPAFGRGLGNGPGAAQGNTSDGRGGGQAGGRP